MTQRIRRFEELTAWQKAFELHDRLQQAMQAPAFQKRSA
jgi:hypothetical protein